MMSFAYPRLPASQALIRLHDMRSLADEDPRKLSAFAAVEHPSAQPVPTGASIASPAQVAHVREAVTDALRTWLTGVEVPRSEASQFDIALGAALHASLQIVPADAAHEETWSFLAAVVLPDVVWARFPGLHQDRVLGKPRNVLRRAWHRHDVIGDLQAGAARPLGEDELTGIFERTAVASNRRLARAMATIILDSDETNRSEFARRMAKQVTKMTGPLLLDVLTASELHDLVQLSAQGSTWPDPAAGSSTPVEDQQHSLATRADEYSIAQRERPSGDLVRQFHGDMVRLALNTQAVLGYRPTILLGLIDDLGGVEAARRVVGSEHASATFVSLWEKGRLDLSVESLVLEPTYAGLFGPDLIDRAAFRLDEHGAPMQRPWFE